VYLSPAACWKILIRNIGQNSCFFGRCEQTYFVHPSTHLRHPNIKLFPIHAPNIHRLRAVFHEVTRSSAAEAFSLNFICGSSGRVNIHRDRVTRSWRSMGKPGGKTVSRWETPEGRGRRGNRSPLLRKHSMRGSEGSIGCLVLVEADGSFIPGFLVQVVWSSGSHRGYRICN